MTVDVKAALRVGEMADWRADWKVDWKADRRAGVMACA